MMLNVILHSVSDADRRTLREIRTSPVSVAAKDLSAEMKQAIAQLRTDSGRESLLVLDGMPLDEPSKELTAVSSLLGELSDYPNVASAIVDVSDKHEAHTSANVFDTNVECSLHTDLPFVDCPPAYIGILQLQRAAEGGATMFCSASDILGALSPGVRQVLCEPFDFRSKANSAVRYAAPILEPNAGAWSVRFGSNEVSCRAAEQVEAVDELKSVLEACSFNYTFGSGELGLYSNRFLLHGRRAFRDDPSIGRVRRGLRSYVC